jgi:hypothetical protein
MTTTAIDSFNRRKIEFEFLKLEKEVKMMSVVGKNSENDIREHILYMLEERPETLELDESIIDEMKWYINRPALPN